MTDPSQAQGGGLIGRERELAAIVESLDQAAKSKGRAILVSGEAGIGKSRLVREALEEASAKGFSVLQGACFPDNAQPFLPFSTALGSALFQEEEYVSFAQVLVIDDAGLLVARASPREAEDIDADIFAGMLTAVQNFVKDSFGGQEGSLGRLEYGNMKILMERLRGAILVAIFKGAEHEDMHGMARSVAQKMGAQYGETLETWEGRDSLVSPVKAEAESLASMRFLVRRSLEGVRLDNERARIADHILGELALRAPSNPVLLVIEDIHWADESSLFVIEYLARSIGAERISVIATLRREEGKKAAALADRLMAEGAATEVPVSTMDEAGAMALINAAFSPNDFPQDFAQRLAKDCRGNPFFLTELLRQMASDGNISAKEGRFRLDARAVTVPSTIEEMAQRRLDGLDPDAMTMAEYVSCIGREFAVSAALSLRTLKDPTLAFEKLRSHGVVQAHVADEIGQVPVKASFAHALFQDAVYKNISPRWKSAYHKSLGEHYERAYDGRLAEAIYELARHFSMTSEHAKAYGYCMKAGEKAEGAYAVEQAITFYASADRIGQKAGAADGDTVKERLGDLYSLAGDFKTSLGSYSALLRPEREPRKRADAHRRMADVYEKMAEFEKGEEECRLGLDLLGEGECVEKTRLLLTLGKVTMRTGDYARAISITRNGLETAKRLDDKREVGRARHLLGSILCFKGDYEEALENLRDAVDIRRSLGDISELSGSLNNIGNVHMRRGALDQALEHYKASLELDRKAGDRMGVANTLTNIASVYLEMGKPDEAIPPLEESIAIEKRIGDMHGTATSLINLNIAHYLRGDLNRAMAMLVEAKGICEKFGLKYESIFCYNCLCEIYSKLKRFGEARESAERALAVSREIETRDGESMALMNLGSVYRETQELGRALETLGLARSMMEELGSIQAPNCDYELGLLWKAKGDPGKAREFFELALAGYEKSGDAANVQKVREALKGPEGAS
ncbi:MAG: tetratricopeptide repeat protein [Euryarchaeota archaeon]|nr:tetratricopeptide repeat protein [Euryarchaeota archaeon]